jgi:hypothetical protein
MNRQGSILIHVLVTGVIVALIAACILRVTLGSYLVTARANSDGIQKRQDEGALNALMSTWNTSASVCSAGAGYACTGAAGTCGCTCTKAGSPTVTTAGAMSGNAPGGCVVTIAPTSDPMAQAEGGGTNF